jgi:hypothetical protein
LHDLIFLDLSHTPVTEAGIKELQRNLPALHVMLKSSVGARGQHPVGD